MSGEDSQAPIPSPTRHAASPSVRAAPALQEMALAWRAGQRIRAEELLARHPDLAADPHAAARVIYEEIWLRQEAEENSPDTEILSRFPQWREELEILLDCHRLLSTPAPPDYPEVGDVFEGFRIVAALGRGAHGRVFLAAERHLADRPVVLKVSACTGDEHLSLARLQHTHIVPLYWERDFPDRNLRVLCMPYLGGATLDRLLMALASHDRGGERLLATADRASPAPAPVPARAPARQLLARLSPVQVACWITACLAEALQYAHERGLVHLDLKPANVLLAADGQPMLLDFHLARAPVPAGAIPNWFGGTPQYMAPEQCRAMNAVREGRPAPEAVDARADVYALGLLLYEALADRHPDPPLPLHRANPAVSVGLSDILGRCLAPSPADRYPDAASLAADLRRHLHHLPLAGVRNRSLAERWHKWRRRKPGALLVYALVLAVAGLGGAAGLEWWASAERQREVVRSTVDEGRREYQAGDYNSASASFLRGRRLAEGMEQTDPALVQAVVTELRQAERARAAVELGRLTDRLRHLYDWEAIPPSDLTAIEPQCRRIWESRSLIHGPDATLPEALARQVPEDLLDLALFWANTRLRLAPPGTVRDVYREAMQTLTEAESLFGTTASLAHVRRSWAKRLGITEAAEASDVPPRTAWDHAALGREMLAAGDLAGAQLALRRAIHREPQAFWPHFQLAVCYHRQGRDLEAVAEFGVCIALAPGSAECYYNRGTARLTLGENPEALDDFNRALDLSPDLAPALLARGVLQSNEHRYPEAEADLSRAEACGAGADASYRLALVHLARGDRATASAALERALRANPGHAEARKLLASLQR